MTEIIITAALFVALWVWTFQQIRAYRKDLRRIEFLRSLDLYTHWT